jgi:hypothetical protein
MDQLKEILEMTEKGISKPQEIILIVISSLVFIYSLLIKFHKIISFNDFDRLLLPKNEKRIQQVIVKISDYFLFSFLYSVSGIFLSVIVILLKNNILGLIIFILILLSFITTLFPILIKVFFIMLMGREKADKIRWLSKLLAFKFLKNSFDVNYYTSFPLYGFLFYSIIFGNLKDIASGLILLLIFPMFLLYLYRSYRKKYDHKYICKIISEDEFNNSMLTIDYTLDKDRMIFIKPDDDKSEIYMYDRSADKYFKFTKVNFF